MNLWNQFERFHDSLDDSFNFLVNVSADALDETTLSPRFQDIPSLACLGLVEMAYSTKIVEAK